MTEPGGLEAASTMAISVRQSRVTVAILFLAAFTSITSGTLISPLLPAIADDFTVSVATAGQLGTVSAIVGMLVALVASPFMDRASRATWLRGQTAVLVLATLLSVFAPSFGWLVVGRILAGLGGAVVMANCFSAAGHYFPDPFRRNRAIGVIVSATTIAILAGLPVMAQIEDMASWRWAIASLLLPLGILFACTWLLPTETRTRTRSQRASMRTCYRRVLGHQPTVWMLATMMIMLIVYVGWLTYFGAYVEEELGRGAHTLSLLFLVAGALELVANNLAPTALGRWSARRIFAVATMAWAAGMLLTGAGGDRLWPVFLAVAALNVGAAILYIIINTLLIDSLPVERGAVMALGSASASLGGTLGATGGGVALSLFDSYTDVYRFLGLLLPLALLTLSLAQRRRTTAEKGVEAVALEPV